MKKLVPFLLALAMCLSLAACGGDGPSKKQLEAMTDAYNQVAPLYTEVADAAEANGWTADSQTIADINTIGNALGPIGDALSGDISSLEGSDYDAIASSLLEYLPTLQALSEKVSVPYDGGSDDSNTGDNGDAGSSDEITALAALYNELAPKYNSIYEDAETNGWLEDEQTAAELQVLAGTITYVGSGLTDDPSKLEDTDINELIGTLNQFSTAMEEMAQRVSVPYEG